jgi:outer membrane protein assembly factor BamA
MKRAAMRGAVTLSLVAAGLCFAAAPGTLHAQQTSITPTASSGAKVVSVTVTGSKKFSPQDLVKASGIAPGNLVTPEDIQAGADRLGALGWFNKVQFKFNTTRDGVNIEFTLEDSPTVPVTFDNFPWFTEQELIQAIRSETGLFDGTAPEAGDALDKMKVALQKLMTTRGIRGEVEATVLAAPGESGMVQQFRLNGPLVKVAGVEFSDPLARNDKHIAERLSDIIGKPYSRYTLDLFAFEYLRPVYLSKGYLRVRFAAPEIRFIGDPRQALPDTVSARLKIETGPVYKWGGITWSGNSAFDAASLDQMTGLTAGEPADGNKIQEDWDRLETEYGKRGYIEAKLDAQPAFDDTAAKISYRVQIAEGIQYRVGQMVITGLSLAAERQLLAAWGLPRGEIFNKKYYDDFVASGARKIFENSAVHFETVGHLLRPNAQTKLVDVLLDFQ